MAKKQITKSGAVSIFVVIFFTLLISILTVGFVKIMISEQQRATSSDLSQSAYDAALAGVEDSKRALRACNTGTSTACDALQAPNDCNVIARAGVAGTVGGSETIVRSSSSVGSEFNQAYTCVNINMETPDFLYEASEGRSQLIPLRAAGQFDTVVVEWLVQDDIGEGNLPTAPSGSGSDLPSAGAWGALAPPLMRAQVITPSDSFRPSDFDGSGVSQTAFIRPISMMHTDTPPSNPSISLAGSPRATTDGQFDNSVSPVICSSRFANDSYSCRAEMTLVAPVSADQSVNAFLRLTPIYKGASVRVSLLSGGSVVNFNGAQPSADVTGRASTLFRRVEARLQVGDDFPYPNYALDANNPICKDFAVDTAGVIVTPSSCDP